MDFLTRLQIEAIPDRARLWKVLSPLRFQGRDRVLEVPEGYITDLTSSPRATWIIVPPTGIYVSAAVLHDFLYTSGILSRKDSDGVFRRAMKASGTPAWQRKAIYWSVRMGGRKAWNKCRKGDVKNKVS